MSNNAYPVHDNKEKLVSNLSLAIDEVAVSFKMMNLDDYEAECFFKGLSDARAFVENLHWLIKRHNNA